MIRNVCVHVSNEQPLIVDLFDLPQASDAGLLCTNVRSLDGKRPIFIDSIKASFFFPYHIIRFLEIPEGAVDLRRRTGDADEPGSAAGQGRDAGEDAQNRMPVVVGGPGEDDPGGDLEGDIEIDEDFLQRIRDI